MSASYKVVPWSYSVLTAFEECPRRFKLTRLTKEVREGQSDAMAEGNRVHKALELYVGAGVPLPEQYAKHRAMADKLRTAPGQKFVEFGFGLTRDLAPTTFFAQDVWARGKLDVAIVRKNSAIVVDYKNGKRRQDIDQLRLFAGAAFRVWPHVNTVMTAYAWLPSNKLDPSNFTREDAPKIWQEFSIRVHRMEEAVKNGAFPPKPSGLCRQWCPVGKSLCEHCGK